MSRLGTVTVVALLILISWSRAAHAETDDDPHSKWGDRTLAGHTFIDPQIAPSGLVTTHVGIRQGVLFRRVPDYPLGPFGSLTLMQVGADEFLDFGLKLSDHVGLYGNLHLTIHAGMNAESILLLPTYSTFAGESGAVIRLARFEETGTQLSLRLGGELSRGYVLQLSALLSEVITSVEQGNVQTFLDVANGDIAKYVLWPTEGASGNAWLCGAQALGPYISLQLGLGARYGRFHEHPYKSEQGARVDAEATQHAYVGSLAIAVDGSPGDVPIGAVAEWRTTRQSTRRSLLGSEETEGETEHVAAGGLYYTGRRNLQVGVGLTAQLNQRPEQGFDPAGQPADSGTPTSVTGSFVLRYIW